ncbi:hypothetical protein M2368_003624 [Arthrobacter sp. JUb119]|nr:hypothetical protein [Arthrobacter sp. JUb119]
MLAFTLSEPTSYGSTSQAFSALLSPDPTCLATGTFKYLFFAPHDNPPLLFGCRE